MKYTQIPVDTFEKLQKNAGVLCTSFNPATGAVTGILGATTGGFQINAAPSYSDYGDDIDNCPKNMMELKNLDSTDVSLSGTLLTVTAGVVKTLIGAAKIDTLDSTHVIPRKDLLTTDFSDLWWVGDYSDDNSDETGGFCAIHIKNALNTGGFQIKSSDKAKGQFPFTFTGHVSMSAQSEVPYEVYIQSGSATATPAVEINKHSTSLAVNEEETLTATVVNSTASVTWSSGDTSKATVTSGGKVKGIAAGNTIITASITDSGVTYTDTCTVVVSAG